MTGIGTSPINGHEPKPGLLSFVILLLPTYKDRPEILPLFFMIFKKLVMKKIILIPALFFLMSMLGKLDAQSINNKNWKAFFSEPFNDTLILHLHGDSSSVTLSNGQVLVQSKCTITDETLILSDYSTGQYSCPDVTGKYKINLKGDILTFTLIEDACEGRAQALDGIKWTKASK
jgi:hypothetical protein